MKTYLKADALPMPMKQWNNHENPESTAERTTAIANLGNERNRGLVVGLVQRYATITANTIGSAELTFNARSIKSMAIAVAKNVA
ncbi:hypothetical protein [Allorhodopirellula heiligendammensis]|uniref:hypothetical protein n=1 Tax=Allorhodopirellula heiligendammensis TaxID=2714739 RepID=UPI00265ED179|nr:hypothetical protein [Allorhodopirellula heiligendammensis]